MQTLGRISRTGQVVNPEYAELTPDIPAAIRFAAVLASKMSNLNANTTADVDCPVKSRDALDLFNRFGDSAVVEVLSRIPGLNEILGSPITYGEKGPNLEDAARRVTGRLPMLSIPQQELLYRWIGEEFIRRLKHAEDMGENTLQARRLDLQARLIASEPILPGIPGDPSPFAAPASADTMEVKVLGKPYPSHHVIEQVRIQVRPYAPQGARTLDDLAEAAQRWQAELIESTRREAAARLQRIMHSLQAAHDAHEQPSQGTLEKQISREREAAEKSFHTWRDAVHPLIPGQGYRLTLPDGSQTYAILISLQATQEDPRRPGRSTALSRWYVSFLLADARKALTLKLSRLDIAPVSRPHKAAAGTQDRGRGEEDDPDFDAKVQVDHAATDERGTPVIELFDRRQGDLRERRTIITGNLFAAFARMRQGQIVFYTTDQGELRQGILMPQGFDLQQFREQQPVELTPGEILKFLRAAPQGKVTTDDGVLSIVAAGEGYLMAVPDSKREGGPYYLDEALREITGGFTSVNNFMRVTLSESRMLRAAEHITRYKRRVFQTETYKEQALRVGGRRFGTRREPPGEQRTTPAGAHPMTSLHTQSGPTTPLELRHRSR